MRSDDDEVGLPIPAAGPTDVLRLRRSPVDRNTGYGNPYALERLFVQQPDPVLVGTLGELLAEAEIVVSVHRRERRDLRRRQTGERVSEIARVSELDDVTQKENQIDPSLGEPPERRVGAPIELLGLEQVDPS
jgi:hypothetical protein